MEEEEKQDAGLLISVPYQQDFSEDVSHHLPQTLNISLACLVGHSSLMIASLAIQAEEHPQSTQFIKWTCYLTNWQLMANFFGEIYDVRNSMRNIPLNDNVQNLRLTQSLLAAALYWIADYDPETTDGAENHFYNLCHKFSFYLE